MQQVDMGAEIIVKVTADDGIHIPELFCTRNRIRAGDLVYVDVHGTDFFLSKTAKFGLRERAKVSSGLRLLPKSGLVREYIDFVAGNRNACLFYRYTNSLAAGILALQLKLDTEIACA